MIPRDPDDGAFAGAAVEAVADADAAPRALRRYFAQHNRQAFLLAMFSLVASALLWALTYGLIYWFTLVVATLSRSFNPETLLQVTNPELLGDKFPWWFAGGAVATLGVAAVVRRKVRIARLREARHYLLWVIVELFMMIPNVTFSVWGNLSAITRLRRREAADAWRLLERIDREGGRMNVASLRQEIDDERILRRVMFGLQLVGLISLRENQEGWFLYLQNRDAFAALATRAQGEQ